MIAFLVFLHPTLKEYGLFGLWLFFPPVLVIYCIVRWQRFKTPIMVFVAGLALAAMFQWARLGYWAWPDVERAV